MRQSLVAEQARADELASAFALIFQNVAAAERPARIANALRLVRQGELDASGVWVLRGQRDLAGAIVCLPAAGASALIWPPQVRGRSRRQEMEDVLLRSATAWVQKAGAKLGQSLLTREELQLGEPLERNGFCHITRLWYLRHSLRLQPHWFALHGELH